MASLCLDKSHDRHPVAASLALESRAHPANLISSDQRTSVLNLIAMAKSALLTLLNERRWLLFAHDSRLRPMLAWMALLTLWLVTRPYHGIWHDSQLYSAQALRLLNPENYARDLFFLYGSQDDYTIFSPLYAQVIRWLGLDQAALTLTILGQALWLLGATALARRLLPAPWHWLGLGLVIVLNDYYGYYTFAYGESFLTPRLYAEGLTMMSLALLVGGRLGLAAGLLMAALLLHPINTLMGGLVAFCWLSHCYPRAMFSVALIGLGLIGVLALASIPPVNGLLLTMSDAWYAISDGRGPYLFLHNWDSGNWSRVALALALLLATWRLADDPLRAVARATVLAVTCGMGLAWLGGEIWHNVLLIQLQTWRVLWIGMVLAALSAAWLGWHFWRVQRDWVPMLGFLSAWLLRDSSGSLVALLTLAYCLVPTVRFGRLAKCAPILVLGLFLVAVVNLIAVNLLFSPNDLIASDRPWQTRLSSLALALGLTTLGLLLFWRDSLTFRLAAAMPAVTGLVMAIWVWDHRTIADKWIDRNLAERARLQAIIPKTSVVYWADSLLHTWFFLERSSYMSRFQIAGVVFHECTAFESQRRSLNLRTLGVRDSVATLPRHQRSNVLRDLPQPTSAGLAQVCEDHVLDWVVLREEFPGATTSYAEFGMTWHLYQCIDFRN